MKAAETGNSGVSSPVYGKDEGSVSLSPLVSARGGAKDPCFVGPNECMEGASEHGCYAEEACLDFPHEIPWVNLRASDKEQYGDEMERASETDSSEEWDRLMVESSGEECEGFMEASSGKPPDPDIRIAEEFRGRYYAESDFDKYDNDSNQHPELVNLDLNSKLSTQGFQKENRCLDGSNDENSRDNSIQTETSVRKNSFRKSTSCSPVLQTEVGHNALQDACNSFENDSNRQNQTTAESDSPISFKQNVTKRRKPRIRKNHSWKSAGSILGDEGCSLKMSTGSPDSIDIPRFSGYRNHPITVETCTETDKQNHENSSLKQSPPLININNELVNVPSWKEINSSSTHVSVHDKDERQKFDCLQAFVPNHGDHSDEDIDVSERLIKSILNVLESENVKMKRKGAWERVNTLNTSSEKKIVEEAPSANRIAISDDSAANNISQDGVVPENSNNVIRIPKTEIREDLEFKFDNSQKEFKTNSFPSSNSDLKVKHEALEGKMDECHQNFEKLVVFPRKTKIDFEDRRLNHEICKVCGSQENLLFNSFLRCKGCNLSVHSSCYGIQTFPIQFRKLNYSFSTKSNIDYKSNYCIKCDDATRCIHNEWLCSKCSYEKNQKSKISAKCEICHHENGDLKPTVDGGWAHVSCTNFTNGAIFVNFAKLEPISFKLLKERIGHESKKKQFCFLCEVKDGLVLKCCHSSCQNYFHISCGIVSESTFMVKENLDLSKNVKCFCPFHSQLAKEIDKKEIERNLGVCISNRKPTFPSMKTPMTIGFNQKMDGNGKDEDNTEFTIDSTSHESFFGDFFGDDKDKATLFIEDRKKFIEDLKVKRNEYSMRVEENKDGIVESNMIANAKYSPRNPSSKGMISGKNEQIFLDLKSDVSPDFIAKKTPLDENEFDESQVDKNDYFSSGVLEPGMQMCSDEVNLQQLFKIVEEKIRAPKKMISRIFEFWRSKALDNGNNFSKNLEKNYLIDITSQLKCLLSIIELVIKREEYKREILVLNSDIHKSRLLTSSQPQSIAMEDNSTNPGLTLKLNLSRSNTNKNSNKIISNTSSPVADICISSSEPNATTDKKQNVSEKQTKVRSFTNNSKIFHPVIEFPVDSPKVDNKMDQFDSEISQSEFGIQASEATEVSIEPVYESQKRKAQDEMDEKKLNFPEENTCTIPDGQGRCYWCEGNSHVLCCSKCEKWFCYHCYKHRKGFGVKGWTNALKMAHFVCVFCTGKADLAQSSLDTRFSSLNLSSSGKSMKIQYLNASRDVIELKAKQEIPESHKEIEGVQSTESEEENKKKEKTLSKMNSLSTSINGQEKVCTGNDHRITTDDGIDLNNFIDRECQLVDDKSSVRNANNEKELCEIKTEHEKDKFQSMKPPGIDEGDRSDKEEKKGEKAKTKKNGDETHLNILHDIQGAEKSVICRDESLVESEKKKLEWMRKMKKIALRSRKKNKNNVEDKGARNDSGEKLKKNKLKKKMRVSRDVHNPLVTLDGNSKASDSNSLLLKEKNSNGYSTVKDKEAKHDNERNKKRLMKLNVNEKDGEKSSKHDLSNFKVTKGVKRTQNHLVYSKPKVVRDEIKNDNVLRYASEKKESQNCNNERSDSTKVFSGNLNSVRTLPIKSDLVKFNKNSPHEKKVSFKHQYYALEDAKPNESFRQFLNPDQKRRKPNAEVKYKIRKENQIPDSVNSSIRSDPSKSMTNSPSKNSLKNFNGFVHKHDRVEKRKEMNAIEHQRNHDLKRQKLFNNDKNGYSIDEKRSVTSTMKSVDFVCGKDSKTTEKIEVNLSTQHTIGNGNVHVSDNSRRFKRSENQNEKFKREVNVVPSHHHTIKDEVTVNSLKNGIENDDKKQMLAPNSLENNIEDPRVKDKETKKGENRHNLTDSIEECSADSEMETKNYENRMENVLYHGDVEEKGKDIQPTRLISAFATEKEHQKDKDRDRENNHEDDTLITDLHLEKSNVSSWRENDKQREGQEFAKHSWNGEKDSNNNNDPSCITKLLKSCKGITHDSNHDEILTNDSKIVSNVVDHGSSTSSDEKTRNIYSNEKSFIVKDSEEECSMKPEDKSSLPDSSSVEPSAQRNEISDHINDITKPEPFEDVHNQDISKHASTDDVNSEEMDIDENFLNDHSKGRNSCKNIRLDECINESKSTTVQCMSASDCRSDLPCDTSASQSSSSLTAISVNSANAIPVKQLATASSCDFITVSSSTSLSLSSSSPILSSSTPSFTFSSSSPYPTSSSTSAPSCSHYNYSNTIDEQCKEIRPSFHDQKIDDHSQPQLPLSHSSYHQYSTDLMHQQERMGNDEHSYHLMNNYSSMTNYPSYAHSDQPSEDYPHSYSYIHPHPLEDQVSLHHLSYSTYHSHEIMPPGDTETDSLAPPGLSPSEYFPHPPKPSPYLQQDHSTYSLPYSQHNSSYGMPTGTPPYVEHSHDPIYMTQHKDSSFPLDYSGYTQEGYPSYVHPTYIQSTYQPFSDVSAFHDSNIPYPSDAQTSHPTGDSSSYQSGISAYAHSDYSSYPLHNSLSNPPEYHFSTESQTHPSNLAESLRLNQGKNPSLTTEVKDTPHPSSLSPHLPITTSSLPSDAKNITSSMPNSSSSNFDVSLTKPKPQNKLTSKPIFKFSFKTPKSLDKPQSPSNVKIADHVSEGNTSLPKLNEFIVVDQPHAQSMDEQSKGITLNQTPDPNQAQTINPTLIFQENAESKMNALSLPEPDHCSVQEFRVDPEPLSFEQKPESKVSGLNSQPVHEITDDLPSELQVDNISGCYLHLVNTSKSERKKSDVDSESDLHRLESDSRLGPGLTMSNHDTNPPGSSNHSDSLSLGPDATFLPVSPPIASPIPQTTVGCYSHTEAHTGSSDKLDAKSEQLGTSMNEGINEDGSGNCANSSTSELIPPFKLSRESGTASVSYSWVPNPAAHHPSQIRSNQEVLTVVSPSNSIPPHSEVIPLLHCHSITDDNKGENGVFSGTQNSVSNGANVGDQSDGENRGERPIEKGIPSKPLEEKLSFKLKKDGKRRMQNLKHSLVEKNVFHFDFDGKTEEKPNNESGESGRMKERDPNAREGDGIRKGNQEQKSGEEGRCGWRSKTSRTASYSSFDGVDKDSKDNRMKRVEGYKSMHQNLDDMEIAKQSRLDSKNTDFREVKHEKGRWKEKEGMKNGSAERERRGKDRVEEKSGWREDARKEYPRSRNRGEEGKRDRDRTERGRQRDAMKEKERERGRDGEREYDRDRDRVRVWDKDVREKERDAKDGSDRERKMEREKERVKGEELVGKMPDDKPNLNHHHRQFNNHHSRLHPHSHYHHHHHNSSHHIKEEKVEERSQGARDGKAVTALNSSRVQNSTEKCDNQKHYRGQGSGLKPDRNSVCTTTPDCPSQLIEMEGVEKMEWGGTHRDVEQDEVWREKLNVSKTGEFGEARKLHGGGEVEETKSILQRTGKFANDVDGHDAVGTVDGWVDDAEYGMKTREKNTKREEKNSRKRINGNMDLWNERERKMKMDREEKEYSTN